MKYVSPAIVNVYRATAAIEGGKDSPHQDSSDPMNPQSASTGYSADE
jgi:hypothetical protein